MFKVKPKENNKLKLSTELILTVHYIKRDKSGYPLFLLYVANEWIWRSAKHFAPIQ